jgi:anti-sigma factor ChrR (cupin superfamily)
MADEATRVLLLTDLFRIADWQHTLPWLPFRDGIDIHRLHEHTGYEHILVLAGTQVDENGMAGAGALIVNPPSTRHSVRSETGCIVLAIYEKPVEFLEAPAAPAV